MGKSRDPRVGRIGGRLLGITLAALLAGPSAASASAGDPRSPATAAPERVTIEAVSNTKPQFVSGGDLMVRITLPAGVDADDVRVQRNSADVSGVFLEQDDGSLLGIVDGLRLGRNTIRVFDADATRGPALARLNVVNHPIEGPVFSGPQQLPFYCETQAFGLPPAEQPFCSAPTQVAYAYRTTGGQFRPLADPDAPPADVAMVTVGGTQLPYVVRIERGTIDRAVYETAALYGGAAPEPLRPDVGWNERLVYTFGGGCNGGYHQGAFTAGVLNHLFLSRGYAVASSSLNVLNNNCSPIISAEVAMMVKEHLIETYGPVEHTIGWGGSGGAIQQYDIADSYPGILDGIVPAISYPDPFSVLGPVVDCRLLNAFYAASDVEYSVEQQRAIEGFSNPLTCEAWDVSFANRVTATDSCDPAIPVEARWDPVTNPDGLKCSAAEQFVNQLGRDRQTGFVNSVLDNVGVQYGLQALRDGVINAEQFVELNAEIGGVDVAGELSPDRTVADRPALRSAYRYNLVLNGGLGLSTTPVIDLRRYLDDAPNGDIHTAEWSYVTRQRMIEQGTVANQVIIEHDNASAAAANVFALDAIEAWLTAIGDDTGDGSLQDKVARNRPPGVGDGCYLEDGTRILEELSYRGTGQCATLYPIASNPRLAAGEPLTRDVLACRLERLDFDDYPVEFTPSQRKRLRDVFRGGVCNYDRPGIGQVAPIGTWLDYG